MDGDESGIVKLVSALLFHLVAVYNWLRQSLQFLHLSLGYDGAEFILLFHSLFVVSLESDYIDHQCS